MLSGRTLQHPRKFLWVSSRSVSFLFFVPGPLPICFLPVGPPPHPTLWPPSLTLWYPIYAFFTCAILEYSWVPRSGHMALNGETVV